MEEWANSRLSIYYCFISKPFQYILNWSISYYLSEFCLCVHSILWELTTFTYLYCGFTKLSETIQENKVKNISPLIVVLQTLYLMFFIFFFTLTYFHLECPQSGRYKLSLRGEEKIKFSSHSSRLLYIVYSITIYLFSTRFTKGK